MTKKQKTAAKIIITLFFVFFILFRIDYKEILHALTRVNLGMYLLAISVFLINQLISSYRWKILLSAQNINIRLITLYKLYLFGFIFNFVLPSNIGGDLVKTYELIKKNNGSNKSDIAVSTMFDRILGLFALVIIAFFAVMFSDFIIWPTKLALLAGILIIISMALFFYVKNDLFAMTINKIPLQKIKKTLLRTLTSFKTYKTKSNILWTGLAISVLFHFIGILNQYLLFTAAHIKIPILFLFFAIPINRLIVALPISFGGIGLNEFSLISLLGIIGISSNDVITYALLGYSFVAVMAISYFLFIVSKKIIQFFRI